MKAMSACGAYACGVVAALTAQNTKDVTGVSPVSPDFLRDQIDTLFSDVRIDAVKIGMLGTAELIETVARAGIAVGVDGIFIETQQNPAVAKSDGANMLRLDKMETLLEHLTTLRMAVNEINRK